MIIGFYVKGRGGKVDAEYRKFVITNVPHKVICQMEEEKEYVRSLKVELKISKIYKHMKEKDIHRLDFMEFEEE